MPDHVDTLSRLTAPLHLQVFVTPKCPSCPRAVLLAHKMASDERLGDRGFDATEFPEPAMQYHVHV